MMDSERKPGRPVVGPVRDLLFTEKRLRAASNLKKRFEAKR